MATMAAAARDIPQAVSGCRDNFTVVAARDGPATVTRAQQPLPTPPNSISPAFPAHGLKAQLQKAKLEPIDSDLDLRGSPDDMKRSVSPAALEASGAITCGMLAKHHLPEILLAHGPLAIRHITGYLTTSVPGFSGIPPAKARRLVVGALEGRGGEGAGLHGDVEFEKVGWGRWDARRRGQAVRSRQPTPPGASSVPAGIPISSSGLRATNRLNVDHGDDEFHFSHDDKDRLMMEYEADRMSMDGSASASCSEAPDDDIAMDDPEDATDDEDWAAMGAAALRAESYPNMAAAEAGSGPLRPGVYTQGGGMRSFSASSGMARAPQVGSLNMAALAAASSDAQEREAIEALLRLGSV
jgi:hypothetical protein